MNTRLFNRAVTTGRKRLRPTRASYHERAPIEEDFGAVRYREETVSSRGQVLTTNGRKYLPNDNSWTAGESWLPEDSTAFGLEEESAWFDDDEDGISIEIHPPFAAPSGRTTRSVVLVSYLLRLRNQV